MDRDLLADLPAAPDAPARAACDELVDELGRLCSVAGWERFARPPVVPGKDAFPDPWEATPLGVATVARRLVAHAGVDDLGVTIVDRRAEAGGVSKLVPTELELAAAPRAGGRARFDLYSIGDDEVVGTIAHRVGAALASRWRAADAPYRGVAADTDVDAWRGSVAAFYAGLGVPAANASFQQYKLGRYQAHLGFAPVEYEVVKAGELTVDECAFLLAVQAIAQDGPVPRGLGGVQADAVRAWMDALAGRAAAVRDALGMPPIAAWPALARGPAEPLSDEPADALVEVGEVAAPARRVMRVPGTRVGIGVLIGMALGGAGAGLAGPLTATPIAIAGGAIAGAAVGRRSRYERCSGCVHVLPAAASACPHCGGEVAGLTLSRADALDVD